MGQNKSTKNHEEDTLEQRTHISSNMGHNIGSTPKLKYTHRYEDRAGWQDHCPSFGSSVFPCRLNNPS
jgi:hypothetical protein